MKSSVGEEESWPTITLSSESNRSDSLGNGKLCAKTDARDPRKGQGDPSEPGRQDHRAHTKKMKREFEQTI